jgi:hypothetical protein
MLIREFSSESKSELLQLVSEHRSPDRAEHLKKFWHWQNLYNPLLGACYVNSLLPPSSDSLMRSFQKPGFVSARWSYPIVGNLHFLNACSSENLAENRLFLTRGDCELDFTPDS